MNVFATWSARRLLLFAVIGLSSTLAVASGNAQATSPLDVQADVHGSDVHVNPVMGLNFSLDATSQHNSATGWAEIVTPEISFRFNRHVSVSGSVPWYPTMNAFVPVKAGGTTTYPLQNGKNLLGDANFAGHFETTFKTINYLLVGTVGVATGNSQYGLSANTTTYNFTNHFEYQIGSFIPEIEFGEGDSTTLAGQNVRRNYSAVGQLANFQAGTTIELPWNLDLELQAYEELPIGNQKVYGTVTRKNKRGVTVTRQVLQGTGAAEDNGFNAELDVPVGRHFRLSGSYNRSLIQALDTASVGITWTARSPSLTR